MPLIVNVLFLEHKNVGIGYQRIMASLVFKFLYPFFALVFKYPFWVVLNPVSSYWVPRLPSDIMLRCLGI